MSPFADLNYLSSHQAYVVSNLIVPNVFAHARCVAEAPMLRSVAGVVVRIQIYLRDARRRYGSGSGGWLPEMLATDTLIRS